MRFKQGAWAVILVAAFVQGGPALADVKVTFVNPAHYSDRDFETPGLGASNIQEIQKTFQELGRSYLKPGQTLAIEVLDIQRAGMFTNRFSPNDVRIVTDATPPRIEVRYSLTQNGKPVMRVQEVISDIDFLMKPSVHYSSDRLVYEKAALRDWFQKRFGEGIPPRS